MDVATFERDPKLSDRIELVELIGRGAMGAVFKAKQQGVERPVAVKMMHAMALSDKESVKRFFREAKVISTLDHINIVKVYAVDTSSEGQPYMVMDYIEGVTLFDLIQQKKLTSETYLDIFIQVASALAHAHARDVVHRDIKPRNILLQTNGDGKYVVKLVDFGIARLTLPDTVPGQKITKTGAIIGSPSYMSPEQCTGRTVDARTDLYSLGCVMYEAATGRVPFEDEDAVGLIGKHVMESAAPIDSQLKVKGLPKTIGKVIALAMEKAPESRYQDAQTLHKDLVAIQSGAKPPFAARTTTHTLPSIPTRRRRKTVALCVVASMIGVACFFAMQAMGHKFEFFKTESTSAPVMEEIKSLCTEGARLTLRKRWAEAASVYSSAYDLCAAHNIKNKVYADVCYARARCTSEIGNFNAANRYFSIALQWYQLFDSQNKRTIAKIYRDWGRSAYRDTSYPAAAEYLTRAYEEYKTLPKSELDYSGQAMLLYELTDSLKRNDKPFSAVTYYPALIEAETNCSWVSVTERAATIRNFAKTLQRCGRDKEAEDQLNLANELQHSSDENLKFTFQ